MQPVHGAVAVGQPRVPRARAGERLPDLPRGPLHVCGARTADAVRPLHALRVLQALHALQVHVPHVLQVARRHGPCALPPSNCDPGGGSSRMVEGGHHHNPGEQQELRIRRWRGTSLPPSACVLTHATARSGSCERWVWVLEPRAVKRWRRGRFRWRWRGQLLGCMLLAHGVEEQRMCRVAVERARAMARKPTGWAQCEPTLSSLFPLRGGG